MVIEDDSTVLVRVLSVGKTLLLSRKPVHIIRMEVIVIS
jgi:hypothetical protein